MALQKLIQKSFQLLSICVKRSILDAWQGFEYAFMPFGLHVTTPKKFSFEDIFLLFYKVN